MASAAARVSMLSALSDLSVLQAEVLEGSLDDVAGNGLDPPRIEEPTPVCSKAFDEDTRPCSGTVLWRRVDNLQSKHSANKGDDEAELDEGAKTKL